MSRFLYVLNDNGASLVINVTEKAAYRKDFKILEYIRQEDYKKITKAQLYEWQPFLEWWVYVVMALSLFLLCVIVNYIVKRLNDVRMEERLVTLYEKTSRSTQVHGVLIEQETKKLPEIPQQLSIGISMIFTKEENRKLTYFEENPIKIYEHESIEEKKRLKNKTTSIISIFKNSNFTTSKIVETPDKGNVRLNNRCASTHIYSVSRENIMLTDRNICKTKSKSVDEFEINFFKDGDQQCKEIITLKEGIISKEVPPLSDLILAKNYPLEVEGNSKSTPHSNILSYKPSLITIPKSTVNSHAVSAKPSLIQIISSNLLNKLSSQHEMVVEKVSKTEVSNELITEKNKESESDLENYIAHTVIQLIQDLLNKLELLDMVKNIEKVIHIPEYEE